MPFELKPFDLFTSLINYLSLSMIIASGVIKANISQKSIEFSSIPFKDNGSDVCKISSEAVVHNIDTNILDSIKLSYIPLVLLGMNQIFSATYKYLNRTDQSQTLSDGWQINLTGLLGITVSVAIALQAVAKKSLDFFSLDWQMYLSTVMFALSAAILNVNANRYYDLQGHAFSAQSARRAGGGTQQASTRTGETPAP